ncbi:unnamed protein product [Cylicocyclus nassatus]|uniref:RRM domain-containing protein n=1 Tax=Cylicocyclus nassatus TaxID=53992 RepID=A0AA36H2C0_CYLNA|nr:unnamed protein product [Cylicocyclus nassatus]
MVAWSYSLRGESRLIYSRCQEKSPCRRQTPEKKARYDAEPETSFPGSDSEGNRDFKRKRLRKRTKGLRELIKNKIEVALRTSPSPLNHLFISRDEAGTPQAPFVEVVRAIGLTNDQWLKVVSLPPRVIESISNITDMFDIEKSRENTMMVKHRPTSWSVEECTVYLDNLPQGCTSEKIDRVARKFGTVVEIHLPRSYPRFIQSYYGDVEVGRRPKSFAFVQFTEPEACQQMCAAYSRNLPKEGAERMTHSVLPLLQRLLAQIRKLSRHRRRRTYAQNMLLMRLRRQQAAIIRKERTAKKRTHKLSLTADTGKPHNNEKRENGKIFLNSQSQSTSSLESCNHRRNSCKRKKKADELCDGTIKKAPTKTRRKHRKRRYHDVCPHSIQGSVSDYFENLQVLTLARYRELRQEYIAMRRKSDKRSRQFAMKVWRFQQISTASEQSSLNRRMDNYRDAFWKTAEVEE